MKNRPLDKIIGDINDAVTGLVVLAGKAKADDIAAQITQYLTEIENLPARVMIPLNNDMTQVLEQKQNDFCTYTVMGTDKDIEWDNVVGEVDTIGAQELFEFATGQKELEEEREV
jgi:DNA recombination-dependent growth factor C